MSRMGEEMILELAASLSTGIDKTAAKKDDKEEKDEKCEKCECDPCECDKKKNKKENKKKDAVMDVLSGLSKIAEELDEAGADEASSLVDDALKVIVNKIQQEKTE